jgi:hypothetical protein
MPDVYISRAGMQNKDLDIKFTNTELGSLKDDLAKLQQQNSIKDERIVVLEDQIQNMRREMAMISEILATKPTASEVEHALRKRTAKGKTSEFA